MFKILMPLLAADLLAPSSTWIQTFKACVCLVTTALFAIASVLIGECYLASYLAQYLQNAFEWAQDITALLIGAAFILQALILWAVMRCKTRALEKQKQQNRLMQIVDSFIRGFKSAA